MTRRELGGLALTPLAAQSQPAAPLVKPKALQPGDTVALVTPSTYVTDPLDIESAERMARHFGLKPKWSANSRKRGGYVAGPIEDRVADLHAAFGDPEAKAVFCTRGGYGAPQLLAHLDYALIRRNPKVLAGYSDITALHLAIQAKAGLATFHAPTLLSPCTEYSQRYFREAVFERKSRQVIQNPPEPNPLRPAHPVRAIRPGKASGRLIGGNLTLVSSLMGTPYEPDTRGRIFFIEDVGEEPYRIDRMLTQLRLAGKFDQCAGLVVGECVDCSQKDYKPGFRGNSWTLNEVFDQILGGLKVPVLSGLLIGHTDDQATLPIGVMAEMDAGAGTLTLLESGVA
jgi:muramoyltetrapeptide carboxypeptidase